MSALKDLEERYAIGQAIFEELFKLSDKDLKVKLLDILEGNDDDILTSKCSCKRLIEDEKPSEISFWFYDGLKVNWSGITYVPEHGSEQQIVKFNKHFKL